MVHGSNCSTWETEAEGPRVQGQPQLHSEFKVSLEYMKPCLKKKQAILNKERFWDKDKESESRKPSEIQIDMKYKTESGTSLNGDRDKGVSMRHRKKSQRDAGGDAKWQARATC